MSNRPVVVDAGPLVAYLNHSDAHHSRAVARFKEVTFPLLTCEAVLTEAAFLLGPRQGHGARVVLEYVTRGAIRPTFRLEDEAVAVAELAKKCANVPMSLADACLVRMMDTTPDALLLTTDSDFAVYRRSRGRPIPTITPADEA
ncbi:MAG: type II toxin-antitoxin system VapC family toxin [Phycisphaerae bacterium]